MSEKTGYLIIYSKKELGLLVKSFNEKTELDIDGDRYEINPYIFQNFISLDVYTSEYSNIENLKKYVYKKYEPDILISSFDDKAYLRTLTGKKIVKSSNAYKKLAEISPLVDFYVSVSLNNNYKHALKLLEENRISLNDIFLEVPIAERCLSSYSYDLMLFAIEHGFHNHVCKWVTPFGDLEKGEHVLHRLITLHDLGVIRRALELGADPNGEDEEGKSLLHRIGNLAFFDEKPDLAIGLIDLLHEYGADFNKMNDEGNSIFFGVKEEYDFKIEEEEEEKKVLYNSEQILFMIIKKFLFFGGSVASANSDEIPILEYYKDISEVYNLLLKNT